MQKVWLDKKISLSSLRQMKSLIGRTGLSTVCEEARCPNISECFLRRNATFMILGDTCTRDCAFCGVAHGSPSPPQDDEPRRLLATVTHLNLSYVVITSPSRDDLSDGGAGMFARCVNVLRRSPSVKAVETLIPDFNLNREALQIICDAAPEVVAHNIETVPSLYGQVQRDADYNRSLELLSIVASSGLMKVKSGIMLGLGETYKEVISVFADLRAAGCDFLTLGQYLAPSRRHYPVQRYLFPAEFKAYETEARRLGFKAVVSGPYVRSSYRAESVYAENCKR